MKRKLTQTALAKLAGISQPILVDLESGKQTTSRKLPAIAKALNCKLAELDPAYEREYVSPPAPIQKKARIVGMTQAGVWTEIEEFEDESFSDADVPIQPGLWAHLPQFSYFVRGKSMDLDRICDRDFIICVKYFDARQSLQSGDIVVVERQKNSAVERTVKRMEVSGKTVKLISNSSDARFAKPIIVNINKDMHDGDGSEVRIIALVIGRWAPF